MYINTFTIILNTNIIFELYSYIFQELILYHEVNVLLFDCGIPLIDRDGCWFAMKPNLYQDIIMWLRTHWIC